MLFSCLVGLAPAYATELDLATATIADLQAAFAAGTLTSEDLVSAYLARIEEYDQQGPTINTVITLNEKALAEAKQADAERKAGKIRGPLHGIPVVLKDNFDTFDMPTTAGSSLLAGSIPPDDAFVVKRLRDAGAIFLAKLNLSEFAAGGGSVGGATDPEVIKAGTVPNGYSSMGGQTRNPHALEYGPSGSSGGTGAAIAAVFAQFGLGTDTASSVRGPSSANGIVGLKPTTGLMSPRRHRAAVAVARHRRPDGEERVRHRRVAQRDGRSRRRGPDDEQERRPHRERLHRLSKEGLAARRTPRSCARLRRQGRRSGCRLRNRARQPALVGRDDDRFHYPRFMLEGRADAFTTVTQSEFKAQIADYLQTVGPKYPKTLDDIVRLANDPKTGYPSREKAFAFKYSASVALDLDDPVYIAAKTEGFAMVKAAVDAIMKKYDLDAIVYLSTPAGPTLIAPPAPNPAGRNNPTGSAFNIANMSGYPDLVVPAGMTPAGLPVTVSFLGPAFSDGMLLGYGYDFEQATHAIRLPKHTPALKTDMPR